MAVSALLLVSTETAHQHYVEKGVPVGGTLMPEHVDITYWEISQRDSYPGMCYARGLHTLTWSSSGQIT